MLESRLEYMAIMNFLYGPSSALVLDALNNQQG